MTKKIIISEEISNNLERLQYEVESRKQILAYIINKDADFLNQFFNKYYDEYIYFFIEYNLMKNDFEKKYLKNIIDKNFIKWSLDFNTREVVVSY